MSRCRFPGRLLSAGRIRGRSIVFAVGAVCIFGCSEHPYELVTVSGSVKYEDGSLIPADSIKLRFDPLAAPLDAKTHPRKGFAVVNVADGTFDVVTTHKYGDGIVIGKHKVLVVVDAKDGKNELVGIEYERPDTTPIEIDTDRLPLEIRVKKPSGGG